MTKGSYNYLSKSSSTKITLSVNNNHLMIFAYITKINTQQAVSMAWKVSFPALEFFLSRTTLPKAIVLSTVFGVVQVSRCLNGSPHGMILIWQNLTSAGPFWLSVFALAQRPKTDWAKLALLDAWGQVIEMPTLQESISRLMNHFSMGLSYKLEFTKFFRSFLLFGETLLKMRVCSKGWVEGISETTW